MKQKNMLSVLAVAALLVPWTVCGAALRIDQVKQRYPWNGFVDIDYTVTDDSALGIDDNLEVLMVDKSVTPAVTNRAIRFLQAPLPLTAGSHRITWDTRGDGMTNYVADAEFHVKVVHYAPAYMVIDVSGGSATNCYPVDFLNGAPLNNFNESTYKGDKIVLRFIRPGSYVAGSPKNESGRVNSVEPYRIPESQHRVAISRPFYIGVFEVTQRQYENVVGAGTNPSLYKDTDANNYRPVDQVSYSMAKNDFIGALLQKCMSKDSNGEYKIPVTGFDLPSEFQWEYACRAGTTKAINLTDDFDNTSAAEQKLELNRAGCYLDNGGKTSYHVTVGSYEPNAWGLYDMLGNVWEWCRDYAADDAALLQQFVDPEGPATGSKRVRRGGSCACPANQCRSAHRFKLDPSGVGYDAGFRLSLTLPQ